jgi:DNA-binding NarL/FixJ family response regulator
LSHLDPHAPANFATHYRDGIRHRQAANVLGISERLVYYLLPAARRRLADTLDASTCCKVAILLTFRAIFPSHIVMAPSSASLYSGRRPRILIADDHVLIAEAIKNLLQPEFQIVGVVSDGQQLLENVDRLKPDLVLLDISMPILNGLDAGEQIKAKRRAIKLIYLTVSNSTEIAAEAFRRGASGYVLKQDGIEELFVAVRRAIRGQSYISPGINKDELGYHLRQKKQSKSAGLTTRRLEILQLLAEGMRPKEIGRVLNIKPGTVNFHKYKTMSSLGITTQAGLLEYALTHCITKLSRPTLADRNTPLTPGTGTVPRSEAAD